MALQLTREAQSLVGRSAVIAAFVLSALACRTPDQASPDTAVSSKSAAPAASKVDASESARVEPPVPATQTVGAAVAPPSASASASVARPAPSPSTAPSGPGLGLQNNKNTSGGCPCGCDHSADMVAELRAAAREPALRGIDDALRTIGDREDQGYITERMVQHRLHLLDLGSDLRRTGPVRFTALPPLRAGASGQTRDGTNVVAALFVHGETTEIVHEKEKLLRASFVVRLELENPAAKAVTLRPPTLEAIGAPVALPVSRWYVAGGDGQPWDGVLGAGETKSVYVIGYAGEALLPGTEVNAAIHVESLTLHAKARARKRWDQAI